MDLAFFSREKIKRDYEPVRTVMNYREKKNKNKLKGKICTIYIY